MLKKTQSLGTNLSRKEMRSLTGGRGPCRIFGPTTAKKCEAYCLANPFFICSYDPYDGYCVACPRVGD